MTLEQAQNEFIGTWASLGTSWGINRTMAQIHALLLMSSEPLSTEDIMQQLNISRGNANMNTRSLIDWGLAEKRYITGERREFFVAGKEGWTMAKHVAKQRKQRELEPLIRNLVGLKLDKVKTAEEKEFKQLMDNMIEFASGADNLMEKFVSSKRNWLFKMASKI